MLKCLWSSHTPSPIRRNTSLFNHTYIVIYRQHPAHTEPLNPLRSLTDEHQYGKFNCFGSGLAASFWFWSRFLCAGLGGGGEGVMSIDMSKRWYLEPLLLVKLAGAFFSTVTGVSGCVVVPLSFCGTLYCGLGSRQLVISRVGFRQGGWGGCVKTASEVIGELENLAWECTMCG